MQHLWHTKVLQIALPNQMAHKWHVCGTHYIVIYLYICRRKQFSNPNTTHEKDSTTIYDVRTAAKGSRGTNT